MILAPAFGLGACSLFTSFSGISEGVQDSGVEAGVADATSDASATDAPPDARGVGDGASPCDASHDLCDDFDNNPVIGAMPPWTGRAAFLPGKIERATDFFRSAPSSFSSTPATSNGTASLTKMFAGAAASMHCELDMRLQDTGTGPSARTDLVDFTVTSTALADLRGWSMIWMDNANANGNTSQFFQQWTYGDGGPGAKGYPTGALLAQQWFHVTLDLITGSPGTLVLQIDGQQVLANALFAPSQNSQLTITVGGVNTQGAWRILYDNVFCDLGH